MFLLFFRHRITACYRCVTMSGEDSCLLMEIYQEKLRRIEIDNRPRTYFMTRKILEIKLIGGGNLLQGSTTQARWVRIKKLGGIFKIIVGGFFRAFALSKVCFIPILPISVSKIQLELVFFSSH